MSFSPTLGRFLERDPEEYVDGLNAYEYERSNPLKYVDPMGTQARRPATLPGAEYQGKNGKWVVNSDRVHDDPDEVARNKGLGLRAWISYTPYPDKCPKCKTIRLIQAVRVTNSDGSGYKYPNPDDHYRFPNMRLFNVLKSTNGYAIDHKPGAFLDRTSPYYNDTSVQGREAADRERRASLDGSSGIEAQPTSAMIMDTPKFESGVSVTLELVARCVETGEYLDSLTWGYTSKIGDTVPMPLVPKASPAPSRDFMEALVKFTAFYHGVVEAMSVVPRPK